jgi:hypothetical protein
MSLVTYSDLNSSVANWLHRTDLTAVIPDLITIAESRLARDLRVSPLIATSTASIGAGSNSVALPAGFLEMVNVQITGSTELQYCSPDTVDRLTTAGTPWLYSIYGGLVQVAPAWTAGGSITMTYFKKETALSAGNATNWYMTNVPEALLYAALIEAAPYVKDDARIAVWEKSYARAVAGVNAQYGNIDSHKRMMQASDPSFNANRVTAGA